MSDDLLGLGLDFLNAVAGTSDHARLRRIEERLDGTRHAAERPWASAFDPPDPAERDRQVTHAEYKLLRRQVAQLQVMLSVLVEALSERNVIDGGAASQRLKEKLAALESAPKPAKPKPPAAAATYRDAPKEPEEMVACAKCRKPVAKRTTRLTSHGAVCDGCFEE